ncbi:hypothetical protein [Rhodoferax sp.]|uniref:hypothetical protein n=1 Tax=Rhodoferax sp. TaxID=50421 RepID=UPI00374D86E4
MTPAQTAAEAVVRERLRERATLLLATDQDVIKLLQDAKTRITEQLAAMPSDFSQWRLPPLLVQIEATLDGATANAAARVDTGLRAGWQAGEDFVDKPLAAAGNPVEMRLQLLDVTVLGQLRNFTTGRIQDIGAEALRKINSSLGLVTLGAQTPFDAIKAIQGTLGDESTRRATTIVRTEVGRAFAMASQQRMEQAAELVPGLQKQWRRSGKIHSRWNHDVIDGQVVDVDKPFILPSDDGTVRMMCPHDPKAPVSEVINCGCISVPFMKGWQVMTPGAKPFTELELKMNNRKALLDQMAKRLGARKS